MRCEVGGALRDKCKREVDHAIDGNYEMRATGMMPSVEQGPVEVHFRAGEDIRYRHDSGEGCHNPKRAT